MSEYAEIMKELDRLVPGAQFDDAEDIGYLVKNNWPAIRRALETARVVERMEKLGRERHGVNLGAMYFHEHEASDGDPQFGWYTHVSYSTGLIGEGSEYYMGPNVINDSLPLAITAALDAAEGKK